MNKTSQKIIEVCSRNYRFLSASEIAKICNLKYVTISQNIQEVESLGFLVSETYGKGHRYRFNFNFDAARKFRLFLDSLYLFSKAYLRKRLETLLENSRKNDNIISIVVYGSCLETEKFNDIDVLVISKEEQRFEGFDVFNLTPDSFRKIFSLGELRLQAALTNGRILIDKEFLFSFFNQDIPLTPSDEIISIMNKNIQEEIVFLDAEKDFIQAKKRLTNILKLKANLIFSKNKIQIPSRLKFMEKLKSIDSGLYSLIINTEKIRTKKAFWDHYYKIKEGL